MEWWQALVLGVVEGLTEYLPVSSTGHLLLAQRALGIAEGDAANAYAICIQAGAILAVLGLYRARVAQALRGLVGRDAEGLRLLLALGAAFVPAAVVGLLFDDAIEELLFGLRPVVGAWLVGGLAILAVARARRGAAPRSGRALEELRVGPAFVIGLFQCLALWPGTSRSLVTIVGALVVGLSLAAAVEFSFLLGVLTLLAATGYKALSDGQAMLATYGAGTLVLGAVAAWLAAVVSVRWMVAWLNRHGLEVFGWYRVALAAAVGGLLLTGVL
ncbi:MAG: undecaprenyl-diphosphate phosphatase [Planctomycetes bacterium]|nr:undecaprenyl-diphosphate phosphatase [Planctomycetota bacterium]